MKHFLKNPKTYLILVIVAPVIILGAFSLNYYRIYRSSFEGNPNASIANIAVKNPFEGIDIEDLDLDELDDIDITDNTDYEVSTSIAKKEIQKNNNETTDIVESTNKTSDQSGIITDNKATELPKKPQSKSYNNIVGTYKIRFERLQQKQESNLHALMEQGKIEYNKSKEKKISMVSLASKYLKLVDNMEKESDKEFNTLINNLKTELKSNSHNTEIVKEISDYYNYYKKNLRAQLMKKATQQL